MFYKMINGLTPKYLSDLVPPFVHENNPHNLRNANDLKTIHHANTSIYFSSLRGALIVGGYVKKIVHFMIKA